MDDEIMKAILAAASQAEDNHERMEIEAYINHLSDEMRSSMSMYLQTRSTMLPEPTKSKIEKWQETNRERIALQIGNVVRIILSKELLGE